MSVSTSRFVNESQIKTNVRNVHRLEVVGRGSEKQLQVGEHLNKKNC